MGFGADRRPALLVPAKRKLRAMPADIRNPSAVRPTNVPPATLQVPAPVPADLPGAVVPLRFGPPRVVTREHTNNAVRWKQGERLNHLLEAACARFADSDA